MGMARPVPGQVPRFARDDRGAAHTHKSLLPIVTFVFTGRTMLAKHTGTQPRFGAPPA
jgi:hypothetical protein